MTAAIHDLTDDELAATFREQIVTAAQLVRLHTPTLGLLATEHILINILGALDAQVEILSRSRDRMMHRAVEQLVQERKEAKDAL